ncbi:MAG: nitroreductase [Lachnospiraceae bacterium]|nr:nitroreductase [Lachnospiraceae bacterium]
MTLQEAMKNRHSVRAYEDRPLEEAAAAALEALIDDCNRESGLHIQLVKNEPRAFDSTITHYGNFQGVSNYLALIGPKGPDLEELCGYYGEKLVLEAQRLGLRSCWVALTYRKIPEAFVIGDDEKLTVVIALGYGLGDGTPHRSKDPEQVCDSYADAPQWFRDGIDAALLAPAAINQQKFRFYRDGNTVRGKAGLALCSKIDLGIAKYHFEIGAGRENFHWR